MATVAPGLIRAGSQSPGKASSLDGGKGLSAAQLSHFRWITLSSSGPTPVQMTNVIWTDGRLVALDNLTNRNLGRLGAVFDPGTRRWTPMATAPGGMGAGDDAIAWTGSRLFVLGMFYSCPRWRGSSCATRIAGLYDPVTNSWSVTALPRQIAQRAFTSAAWDGHQVIVAGIWPGMPLTVDTYTPATGRWKVVTPRPPVVHQPKDVSLVAAGGRVLLWSDWISPTGETPHGVDVLALGASGSWTNVTGSWPQNRTVTPAMSAAGQILFPAVNSIPFWACSQCITQDKDFRHQPGYLVSPATLAAMPISGGPLADSDSALGWTGRAVIGVSIDSGLGHGYHGHPVPPGTTAIWDPAAGRWYHAQRLRAKSPYVDPDVIWDGTTFLAVTATGAVLEFARG
jgi:hypothetical protein